MKPPLIQRLKDRLLVSGLKKQQGVAILTVLAIITLMTVLVVSFFTMARSAQATAKGSVEIQRVTTLKDTIINLVIAQFREASKLSAADARDFNEIVTWTSQPGAIRTYSGTDPAKNKVFKLYSSDVPQLINRRPGETDTLIADINKDVVSDWAQRPDEFTDMNRPVYTAASGDKAIASGSTDVAGYSYPIADPRMYTGSDADVEQNVEGFDYTSDSMGKRVAGVSAKEAQLAMPVRWIYQLQDGTLGYLSSSKEFKPLNGEESGEPSRLNPIVGRLAWWADDESCKVNVNTASVPAIWDTPRTTSKEDVWLAKTQPLAGEYQRYPGHPATVDLSAVLYPGTRFVSTDGTWDMSIGSMRRALTDKEANLIWDLAPFIVGANSDIEYGTVGGTKLTPGPKVATVGFEGDDHLFSSMDEVYFKASASKNVSLNKSRESLLSEKKDDNGNFLKRLERSQFFLTHKSHSPELTSQGFPRVSMFPMETNATDAVINPNEALPTGVSPYDVTIALNSTIGNKPYYFQRHDPNSRHVEFYQTSGAADSGRNANLFKYLKELTKLPIPGYPKGYPGSSSFVVGSPTLTEDPDGESLASKYPAGLNPVTGNRYLDSGLNAQNGQSLMDASDRTQILLNMLDYTRAVNMQPGFITNVADRYDDGNGQATGVCGCGNNWGADHGNALMSSNTRYRAPKSAGKIMAPSEIGFVINVAGKKTGTDAALGDWNKLAGQLGTMSKQVAADNTTPGTRYIVEVGIALGCFNPKIGWAPIYGRGGVVVSGVNSTADNPISPALSKLPILCNLDGKRTENLTVCADQSFSSGVNAGTGTPRKIAKGLIPYGGMQGPRAIMTATNEANGFAICSPVCIVAPSATDANVSPAFMVDPGGMIRILPMDGEFAQHNVVNAVELSLPTDFLNGIRATYTGLSLRTLAARYSQLTSGAVGFPAADNAVRSFVIPHGDYRLATSLKMDSDLFVAHQGYTGRMAHSFYEANEVPSQRKLFSATYSPMGVIDTKKVNKFQIAGSSPMVSTLPLPAADPADMDRKRTLLYKSGGPDPDVEKYASREPDRALIFSFGRRDGNGKLAKRGSSDPDETGDFDNGPGAAEDGPYMNYADEGDRRSGAGVPYFTNLTKSLTAADGKPAQNLSPNFLVRSPVDFGSIPSGIQARVPWQTLRFRPDPGMNDPSKIMASTNDNPPPGLPFANFCGPRDHFFLDMFWMPVVEPYSISEPFSTKGTINLNQQIFPFLYINRTTALHALLRGERMLAIPNDAADKYKKVNPTTGAPDNSDESYRYFINAKETVKQFLTRYKEGKDPEGFKLAFNTFRSASEICEVWLVPDKNGKQYEGGQPWDLAYTIGTTTAASREGFWEQHRLTGDNSRERPYANLYPRVTVHSNVFKLHLVAQTLQKARSESPETFNGAKDSVTAEWRGSCMIERSIDPRDAALKGRDYTLLNAAKYNPTSLPKLDKFYTYRVTEVKQLTQ